MKPMLATPMYGGMCTEGYFMSMLKLVVILMQKGIDHSITTTVNESLVSRARNMIVTDFLNTDCTHLFFIDADTKFSPEEAYNMMALDVPVVAASCPIKVVKYDRLVGHTILSEEHAVQLSSHNNVNYKYDESGRIVEHHGLPEVQEVGTGFMCIRRDVIEEMIRAYPETRYISDSVFDEDRVESYALFDTGVEDGRYLSEGYTFCRRWQRMGGKVLLDPRPVLTHIGTMEFRGASL